MTEDQQTLIDLIKNGRIGFLTTVGDSGKLVSRPMGLQTVEFDGDLWFFTHASSNKSRQIAANPEVNVSFQSGNDWVSLAGSAVVVEDRAKSEQLWNPFIKAWFPDGLDDPELRLIKVHADSAEYWKGDAKPIVLIKSLKAAATGTVPDVGENKSVEL